MRYFLNRIFKMRFRHSEYTSSGGGWFFDIKRVLRKAHTKWQHIEVVQTTEFGKALILDGITQLTETLEYQYHEPMAHLPLLSHPCPRRVLVIGGGDGALVREILRHPSIEHIDFVELDAGVVAFCRAFLPDMGGSAFDDPRVTLHIEDGRSFATRALSENKHYDAIFMDMTDPSGPSLALYSQEFFSIVHGLLLNSDSFFIMHTESPDFRASLFARINATLRSVFKSVTPVVSHVRMYGGLWSWAICTNCCSAQEITKDQLFARINERCLSGLRIVGAETWQSFFTLWPEHRALLSTPIEPSTDENPGF